MIESRLFDAKIGASSDIDVTRVPAFYNLHPVGPPIPLLQRPRDVSSKERRLKFKHDRVHHAGSLAANAPNQLPSFLMQGLLVLPQ